MDRYIIVAGSSKNNCAVYDTKDKRIAYLDINEDKYKTLIANNTTLDVENYKYKNDKCDIVKSCGTWFMVDMEHGLAGLLVTRQEKIGIDLITLEQLEKKKNLISNYSNDFSNIQQLGNIVLRWAHVVYGDILARIYSSDTLFFRKKDEVEQFLENRCKLLKEKGIGIESLGKETLESIVKKLPQEESKESIRKKTEVNIKEKTEENIKTKENIKKNNEENIKKNNVTTENNKITISKENSNKDDLILNINSNVEELKSSMEKVQRVYRDNSELSLRENEIIKKEQELNNKKADLNIQEANLNTKYQEIIEKEQNLLKKEQELHDKEVRLKIQEEEVENLKLLFQEEESEIGKVVSVTEMWPHRPIDYEFEDYSFECKLKQAFPKETITIPMSFYKKIVASVVKFLENNRDFTAYRAIMTIRFIGDKVRNLLAVVNYDETAELVDIMILKKFTRFEVDRYDLNRYERQYRDWRDEHRQFKPRED